MMLLRTFTLAGALVAFTWPALAVEPVARATGDVSYYREIRPIIQQHCQGCHQPAKPQGGLVMTYRAALLKAGESGQAGVVPGKPESSAFVTEILPTGGKPPRMPKGKDALPPRDVELIKKWIAQGAKDDSPSSARQFIDLAHPPVYDLPPVTTSLDYSPDGSLLAVAGYHEVLVYDALLPPNGAGLALVARLVGESERIQSVAFSPDGTLLAVTGGSPGRFGEVQIWDVEGRKLKLALPVTYDTLYGASWSPDGKLVAFGGSDNSLRAIEAATGKQVLYQGAHSDWVLNTVFSRDGTHLVSVSRDRSMKLTEVATQRFNDNITSITPGALKGGLATVARRPRIDNMLQKVPPDTPGATPKSYDELLIGGSDGVPRLYKMHRETKRVIGDDANKVREFESLPGRIYACAFSADGNLLAVGSSSEGKGEARIYQAGDGKLVAKLEGQQGPVFTVAFHPNGREIATAGFDGIVRLNDSRTGKLLRQFVAVPLRAGATARAN